MNLRYLTHPELLDQLKTLQATEPLTPGDARTVNALLAERSFTRSQKEVISKLSTKYRSDQHDRYAIKLN